MSRRPRIAIAGFHHETNTFAPFDTPYERFLVDGLWPGRVVGYEVIRVLSGTNIPIAGFMEGASDFDLVPILWTCAEPSGRVNDDAFERIAGSICEGIAGSRRLDAVFLDLHGAMVTESYEDGEGELLRRVRAIVGSDLPLVVALDFHANITPEMVERASAIAIYRTYPHIDLAETGRRAQGLLRELLKDPTPFHKGFQQLPYLIPLSAQSTYDWPCNALYALLPTLEGKGVASVDFAAGFPAADIAHCGAALIAYGRDKAAVELATKRFEVAGLGAERAFAHVLMPAADAVVTAKRRGNSGRPVVLADVQDNPGAGGSSDTTGLLRAMVEGGARNAVLALFWDPAAARAAHTAGIGSEIGLALGGRFGEDKPFEARFMVEGLSDGSIRCHGPVTGDLDIQLGAMALLRVVDKASEVRVVVNSVRTQCLDRAMIEAVGLDPAKQSIVALKSTNHFRADFEAMASEIIMLDAPGAHPCRLDNVRYHHLRPGVRLGPNGPVHRA